MRVNTFISNVNFFRVYMKSFDCFQKQKQNALISSYEIMLIVLKHADEIFKLKSKNLNVNQIKSHFFQFLKVNLIVFYSKYLINIRFFLVNFMGQQM